MYKETTGECVFTKYMFLEQHSNRPIGFEGHVYSLSSLGLQPWSCACTSVLFTYHLFSSDFRVKLWLWL